MHKLHKTVQPEAGHAECLHYSCLRYNTCALQLQLLGRRLCPASTTVAGVFTARLPYMSCCVRWVAHLWCSSSSLSSMTSR
jgi:hypothetical protein